MQVPQKASSLQIHSFNHYIEVNKLPFAVKGVMPVEQDVSPGSWRYLSEPSQCLGVIARLVLGQQPGQDRGVVIDDRVGNQTRALVADLYPNVGASGQLFLAPDLGDGRA